MVQNSEIEQQQTAVITGASSGIGYALSKKALQLGYNAIMIDVRDKGYNTLKSEMGDNNLTYYEVDVTDSKGMHNTGNDIIDQFGKVDLLFNNAGIGTPFDLTRNIWEIPIEDWKITFEINVMGIINGIHAFLPHMIEKQSGYIVNTASLAGFVSNSEQIAYLSSKHAVVALTEGLFLQLKNINSKIGVSVLVPGPIKTSIVQHSKELYQGRIEITQKEEEKLDQFHNGLQKAMLPEEVANLTFEGIEKNQFYILTHNWLMNLINKRNEAINLGSPIKL